VKSRTTFLGANVFLLKTCTLQQDIKLWIISLKRWANWSCLYTPCEENQLSNHTSIVERQNFWSSQNSRLQTFSSHYSELNWLWPLTRRGNIGFSYIASVFRMSMIFVYTLWHLWFIVLHFQPKVCFILARTKKITKLLAQESSELNLDVTVQSNCAQANTIQAKNRIEM
jgi:hypothetical protein